MKCRYVTKAISASTSVCMGLSTGETVPRWVQVHWYFGRVDVWQFAPLETEEVAHFTRFSLYYLWAKVNSDWELLVH